MSSLPVVVLTNATFPETRAMFDGVAQVVANNTLEPWREEDLRTHCHEASGIMTFMPDRIDAEFLDNCPKLKVVGAALKGYDNIDVEAATKRDVLVTICPDLLTVPTAELAIGLMLSLGRHMLAGDTSIRQNGFSGWRPNFYGTGLDGSRVGIIGFGLVGQAIAERLIGFRCQIMAFDSATHKIPSQLADKVKPVTLADLLSTSDFVVLALPLTPTTQHMIDDAAIAHMKPGSLLINPARGSLVCETAVADAIDAGHIGGYAADVFECEDWARPDRPKCIEHRLMSAQAPTVLTPHIGSAVTNVRKKIEASAASSIIDVLQGGQPVNAINMPSNV